ncbi:hypothetical protein AB4167_15110 [Vibrio sp. 10N.286.49.E11]|uniref:hypothetical protein n=1 Tax=Vibrio sp. 10N.286.49.E11 TaxID=3229703 RepID=UPI003551082D
MLIGLDKSKKKHPIEFEKLTDLQKIFYEVCEMEFIMIKNKIKTSEKTLPIRQRTINKSSVCRKVKENLNREHDLNHSNMSRQNCPFLYNSIKTWNEKLKSEHELSRAKANEISRELTKDDLKDLVAQYEKEQIEIGRDFFNYIKASSLVESESELQVKLDQLTQKTNRQAKELVHLKKTNESIVTQLAGREQDTNKILSLKGELIDLKKKVIKLQTLLATNNIDYTQIN